MTSKLLHDLGHGLGAAAAEPVPGRGWKTARRAPQRSPGPGGDRLRASGRGAHARHRFLLQQQAKNQGCCGARPPAPDQQQSPPTYLGNSFIVKEVSHLFPVRHRPAKEFIARVSKPKKVILAKKNAILNVAAVALLLSSPGGAARGRESQGLDRHRRIRTTSLRSPPPAP